MKIKKIYTMNFRYFFISCVTFFVFFASHLTAQVISDNVIHNNANAIAMSNRANATLSNFNFPAGSNKLLLVGVLVGIEADLVLVNTVTFGTNTLVPATGNPFDFMTGVRNSAAYFYYLTAAELSANTVADITVNLTSSTLGGIHVFAASYSQVDQANPLSNPMGVMIPMTNASQTNSIAIPSANGDMVADIILAATDPTTFTEGAGQSLLAATNNLQGDSKMSEKSATGGTTTMSYDLRFANDGGGHYGINIQRIQNIEEIEPIPTMSEWGLLIFGLIIMNLGVFFVQRRELIS